VSYQPKKISRRTVLKAGLAASLLSGLNVHTLPSLAQSTVTSKLQDLAIFKAGFPRAVFFRQAEVLASRLSYEEWEKIFLPLDGIIGKVFAEERNDTVSEKNLEYFTRFKARHPEKLVVTHVNGRARLHSFEEGSFFAGHWLYKAGTTLRHNLEGSASVSLLHVEDTSVFSFENGVLDNQPDDICIVPVTETGDLDWYKAEQVKLISVDTPSQTIRVERGAYGTTPLAFLAGAYLAPHVTVGPWCPGCERLWLYNFSPFCPRDQQGNRALDILAEQWAAKFRPGGVLETFDGIQFDVFAFFPQQRDVVDINVDGNRDSGVVDNLNLYGLGTLEYIQKLHGLIGNEKLILVDGSTSAFLKPSYLYVNGIEMEGFPTAYGEFEEWSEGYNLLNYWQQHGQQPRLNYVNHKFFDDIAFPINYAWFRLVLATTLFTDTVCTFYTEPEGGSLRYLAPGLAKHGVFQNHVTVFDELWKGVERQAHWLGNSLGPTIHLASQTNDLLDGAGSRWNETLLSRMESTAASSTTTFSREESEQPRIYVTCETTKDNLLAFRLKNVLIPKGDLLVSLTLSAKPFTNYPGVTRLMTLQLVTPSKDSSEAQIRSSVVGGTSFNALFYFRNLEAERINLIFQIEGHESIYLERLAIYAAQNGIYREFEHGLVLANPSSVPYTFDLAALSPGNTFRRLQGSTNQDLQTNNGLAVINIVTLPAEDALFLVKE
jgi:thiol-disulfide isomerase/thioredoxin